MSVDFNTLGLEERTIKLLNEMKVPRFAYVRMEAIEYDFTGQKAPERRTAICTINVSTRPEQLGRIQNYERKGFKVIDYGNFPAENSPIAKMHSQGGLGKNPWKVLAQELDRRINKTQQETAVVKGLQAKVADMEAKLKDMEAKTKAKNER